MISARVRDRTLFVGLAVVLVIVVGAVALAVGRNANHDPGTLPSLPAATSLVTNIADKATNDASAAAIAAYNGYWESYVAASATATAPTGDLAKYVADPMLSEVRLGIQQGRQAGLVYRGRPKWTPRVTSVNITSAPHSVTIEDCFDTATWEPIFSATGKSAAAPGQATRYIITSTVKLYENGGWLVADSQADRSRLC